MQTVIDELLINYEVIGKNPKNTLLILHGWGRSTNDWLPIAKIVSEKFKVILIDLPGFGGSSVPNTEGFGTYEYAAVINKFINKLNLKDVILMGHSFGGKVSMVVASENKTIKKLILVDPSGVENKTLGARMKNTIFSIIKPFQQLLPQGIKSKLFNVFASPDYKSAGALKDSFKKIVSQDVSQNAKKINISTLIIWGDKDKEVPIVTAKKLKSLIKYSTIKIVWGTGHDPFLEKQSKFLEIIEKFI